jgi:glycine/D-amino acid oxidase-like deaminating enzyme
MYAEANQSAVEQVEAIIKRERIDCDWARDDNYVYTADPSQIQAIKQEAQTAASLGLPATFETATPLPFDVLAAVKFASQGKMNTQKYVLGLAGAVDGGGSYVFEHSKVIGIREGRPGRVRTSKGTVRASHIIVATNVPTLPLVARGAYCFKEYPTESYIVAGRLERDLPGMYISPDKEHYSILPLTVGQQRMLLIGGEGHLSGGKWNHHTRYQRLADYAQKHFGVSEILNRWSDRDYLVYDNIPLVGRLYPWSKELYVATGFLKWGLSNGTVSGMILSDLIQGKPNPWAETFDSNRMKPVASIPRAVMKHISG